MRPAALRPAAAAGAVLWLLAFVAGCATVGAYPEPPRVSLVSIQPMEMTLLEQRYALQIRILNPNETAIPIEGLNYAIELNGREFAYGVSRQEATIPPFGEALLDVEVVSNLLNVLQQVQEMSDSAPQESLQYRLVGKLSLDNSPARLPFDFSGELKYRRAEAAAE